MKEVLEMLEKLDEAKLAKFISYLTALKEIADRKGPVPESFPEEIQAVQ